METISPVKERLIQLCNALQISTNQFSIQIGKNREFIRKITGEIGSDVLRKICLVFPTVNILWIITGDGDKFIKPVQENNDSLTNYLKERVKELEDENRTLLVENAQLRTELGKPDKKSKTA